MAKKKTTKTAEVTTEPTPTDTAKVKPDPTGDIDQRMAALLKDHQKMGAR